MTTYKINSTDLANNEFVLLVPYLFFFWRVYARGTFEELLEIADKTPQP